MGRPKLELRERLARKLVARPSGCVEWVGAVNDAGYGIIWSEGRWHKAHRLAWMFQNGEIPQGMFICHKCDNPRCANPDHLFLGTPADNTKDCIQKGRYPSSELRREIGLRANVRGERHCRAKLTAEQVKTIKKLMKDRGIVYRDLALEFGVSPATICDIKAGRSWGHIQEEV